MAATKAPLNHSKIVKNTNLPTSLASSSLENSVDIADKVTKLANLLKRTFSLCEVDITLELDEPLASTTVSDAPSEFKKVLPKNCETILNAVICNYDSIISKLKETLTLINGKKQGDKLGDVWLQLTKYKSLVDIINNINKGLRELYEIFSHNYSDFNVPYAVLPELDINQTPIPYTRKLLENCGTSICECVTVSRMIQLVLKWDNAYPGEIWVPDAITLLERDLTQCLSTHVTTPL